MNNSFDYYRYHMNSPVGGYRRETEIEYIFRIAREKVAAEKAERRRILWALVKGNLARAFSFKRTPSLQALLGG